MKEDKACRGKKKPDKKDEGIVEIAAPGMANEMFMRSDVQPGVMVGRYPEVDMSEELPPELQPRHKRPKDELIRQP